MLLVQVIISQFLSGTVDGKTVTLTAGARDIYVVVEDAAGNISAPLKIVAEAYVSGGGASTYSDFTFKDVAGGIEITGYTGAGGAVTIPSEINGIPVVSIRDSIGSSPWSRGGVFEYKRITSVSMPSSIVTIGSAAFADNQLTSVTMPGSVVTIGSGAFASNQLTSVSIPSGVTSIAGGAFQDNLLTSVTIHESVVSIGSRAFANNQFTSISMTSVITIGDSAFSGNTSLKSVSLPQVATIGESAFADCTNLERIDLPQVTTIGNMAFYNCLKLIRLNTPKLASIGALAFAFTTRTTVPQLDITFGPVPPSVGLNMFNNNRNRSVCFVDSNGNLMHPGTAYHNPNTDWFNNIWFDAFKGNAVGPGSDFHVSWLNHGRSWFWVEWQ